jgi:cbb3-type cytochrome oxidase subunit 1
LDKETGMTQQAIGEDRVQEEVYADAPVRLFALAAVVWGVVGMAVGVFIAAQLAWPELNFGVPRLITWSSEPARPACLRPVWRC